MFLVIYLLASLQFQYGCAGVSDQQRVAWNPATDPRCKIVAIELVLLPGQGSDAPIVFSL